MITEAVYRHASCFAVTNNGEGWWVMRTRTGLSEERSKAVRREERIGAKTPSNRLPFHS